MADIRELYSRRIEAASIALARVDRTEAERLYAEALRMGEENFGADDVALAVPLNELSRLYVRRSEFARAEPLLQRLLGIRCASGPNHPDVATVLAALAAVRRGLGDDVGAEGLYRQALEIREIVHAPDHMAVVVTLEHLADTCAALRKFPEAIALIERAMAARTKALGAEHATVLALKERLTALAAKSTAVKPEASLPLPPPPPPAATVAEEAPITNELVFLYEPEKPKRRASVKRERAMTPQFSAAVAAASLITAPAQAAPPPRPTVPTQVSTPSLLVPDPHEFDAAIMPRATEERLVVDPAPRRSQPVAAPARAEEVVADRPKKKGKTKRYGFAAGGVVMLATVGFFASSRLPTKSTAGPAPTDRASEPVASFSRASVPTAAAAMVAAPAVRIVAAHADSARHLSAKPVSGASVPKQTTAAARADQPVAVADLPVMPVVGSVVIPEANAPNVDSMMRANTTRRDDNEPVVSAGRLRPISIGEDHSETSPQIIGVAPQPRFPDALRSQRIEGTVVVQFLVGTDGNVDASSMKVVRSPHELFTAAVRNVLPKLHFTPARGADAKARAEWVQYSIEFSATK